MGTLQATRIQRLLERRGATVAILGLTLLFTLPSATMGFFADDYELRASILRRTPFSAPWYDLYWFVPGTTHENQLAIAAGQAPWWTSPGIKMHFLRPLASVLLTLDEKLFGDAAIGWHLHSIAWYLALVAVVSAVYRRFLPRATGTLALLVFALSEAHQPIYNWPAARHGALAAVPAFLALLAYARDCEDDWRPGRWLAALGFAVGLAAGETALTVAAFGLAYACLAPTGATGRRKLLAALPSAGVLAVYIVVYKALGCGVAHSGAYFDPVGDPVSFAVAALTRVPVLLGNIVLLVPSEFSTAFPVAPFVILGALGVLAVAWLYRAYRDSFEVRERAALRWLVPGGLVALLVSSGGFPGARLVVVPDVGFAAMFAVLFQHAFRGGRGRSLRIVAERGLAGLLALFHLVFAPLLVIGGALFTTHLARVAREVARDAEVGSPPARVFVLAASDPMVGIYPAAILGTEGAIRDVCWTVLSGAKAEHVVTRTGPSTLTIEPQGTTMLRGAFEVLYRPASEALHVGDASSVCGATVRVAEVRQGLPTRIEVDFGAPLEDPALRLLAWRAGKLQRVAPPPEGGRVELAWSLGPMGMF